MSKQTRVKEIFYTKLQMTVNSVVHSSNFIHFIIHSCGKGKYSQASRGPQNVLETNTWKFPKPGVHREIQISTYTSQDVFVNSYINYRGYDIITYPAYRDKEVFVSAAVPYPYITTPPCWLMTLSRKGTQRLLWNPIHVFWVGQLTITALKRQMLWRYAWSSWQRSWLTWNRVF